MAFPPGRADFTLLQRLSKPSDHFEIALQHAHNIHVDCVTTLEAAVQFIGSLRKNGGTNVS